MEITDMRSPADTLQHFYLLATTLRDSGIPQDELRSLERIWLQRRDIPGSLYHYAYAAFIAGFTGQPKPDLDALEAWTRRIA